MKVLVACEISDKVRGAFEKQEVRSETFPGIANAMALQWGTYLKNL